MCTPGHPPTTQKEGGPQPPGLLSRTQPDLDGTTEGGACRDISGASTWIHPLCQVPVESHEGQTGATQRLCSPHPLASLPLRQEKWAVTGPGRPGPGGPRSSAHSSSSNIWLLSAWGAAWPVLAEAGWGLRAQATQSHPPGQAAPSMTQRLLRQFACLPQWGARSRCSPPSQQSGTPSLHTPRQSGWGPGASGGRAQGEGS